MSRRFFKLLLVITAFASFYDLMAIEYFASIRSISADNQNGLKANGLKKSTKKNTLQNIDYTFAKADHNIAYGNFHNKKILLKASVKYISLNHSMNHQNILLKYSKFRLSLLDSNRYNVLFVASQYYNFVRNTFQNYRHISSYTHFDLTRHPRSKYLYTFVMSISPEFILKRSRGVSLSLAKNRMASQFTQVPCNYKYNRSVAILNPSKLSIQFCNNFLVRVVDKFNYPLTQPVEVQKKFLLI